jgi:hypothetical protein
VMIDQRASSAEFSTASSADHQLPRAPRSARGGRPVLKLQLQRRQCAGQRSAQCAALII